MLYSVRLSSLPGEAAWPFPGRDFYFVFVPLEAYAKKLHLFKQAYSTAPMTF
jgi:hypothetical protein